MLDGSPGSACDTDYATQLSARDHGADWRGLVPNSMRGDHPMISAKGTILVQFCARLSRVWKFAAVAIAALVVCLPLMPQSNEGRISGTGFDEAAAPSRAPW